MWKKAEKVITKKLHPPGKLASDQPLRMKVQQSHGSHWQRCERLNTSEIKLVNRLFVLSVGKVIQYRCGNEDCVQIRHVLFIQCLYRHSAGRPVLIDIIVLWQSGVNEFFIPLSDVTNSEHKLRQFCISQTMYSTNHGLLVYNGQSVREFSFYFHLMYYVW